MYTTLLFNTADTCLDLEFDSFKETLQTLHLKNYKLGFITDMYEELLLDKLDMKDSPNILVLKQNEKSNEEYIHLAIKQFECSSDELLYIGNTLEDMHTASKAEVNFGIALWRCLSSKGIYATHYFSLPQDITYFLSIQKNAPSELSWVKHAMELQFIGQAGLTYSKNSFDLDRFKRIREIAAEMLAQGSGYSTEYVQSIFCNETGYQTPKLDTRAAIFKEDKILLVREKNGTWSLPGGWVDINESIATNTIKEVKEEAGLDVIPTKLIAVQDRNLHNLPIYAYGVIKAFVLCEVIDGEFTENMETTTSQYFGRDELPQLAEEKNNRTQVHLCFDAYYSKQWNTIFD